MNSYRLSTFDEYDDSSVWYFLDEFGSSILHSDLPNCKLVPFLYTSTNKEPITFSLLWPVSPIRKGSIIYVDYLQGVNEYSFRSFRLYPWFIIPTAEVSHARDAWYQKLQKALPESLLSSESSALKDSNITLPIKIATDIDFIQQSLSDSRFSFTSPEDAEIL